MVCQTFFVQTFKDDSIIIDAISCIEANFYKIT